MYSIGFYWNEDSGSVGNYSFGGNEAFYGTLKEVKLSRTYCQTRPDNIGPNKRDYKIFQLVEIPE